MADDKKSDDPAIIPEAELDDVNAGFQVSNAKTSLKLGDIYIKVDEFSNTADASLTRDVLSYSFKTVNKLD